MACTWSDTAPGGSLYPWSNLTITSQPTEARELSEKILCKGDESFQGENYYDALWKFEHWIKLVEDYKVAESRVHVLHKMAVCCLHLGEQDHQCSKNKTLSCEAMWYTYGIGFATRALKDQPDPKMECEVSICRAKVTQNLLRISKYKDPDKCRSVISDCLSAYGINKDMKQLAATILIARDYGLLEMVSEVCSILDDDASIQVIKQLLKSEDLSIYKFLFTKSWASRVIPLSDCGISMKELCPFKDKKLDQVYMDQLLKCSILVDTNDIVKAIHIYSEDEVDSFKLLVSHCQKPDIQILYRAAFDSSKMVFLLHLIKEYHIPPSEDGICILLSRKCFSEINNILNWSFTNTTFENLDLSKLLKCGLVYNCDLVANFLTGGINPNGISISSVEAIMEYKDLKPEDKIDLLSLLFHHGADCLPLIKYGCSPLHVATELSLQSGGNTDLIKAIVCCQSTYKYDKEVNDKEETPLHLAVKDHIKAEISYKVLAALLDTHIINVSAEDKDKKKAIDYIPLSDSRLALFEVEYQKKSKKLSQDSERSENNSKRGYPPNQEHDNLPAADATNEDNAEIIGMSISEIPTDNKLEQLEYHIKQLSEKGNSYFDGFNKSNKKKSHVKADEVMSHIPVCPPNAEVLALMKELNDNDLAWEVEITKSVVNFFCNNDISYRDRVDVVKVIYQLANGHKNACSPIKSKRKDLCIFLYKACTPNISCILWEKAISYSSELSDKSQMALFTDVIRVWEIILNNDDNKIGDYIEQIELSYELGCRSSVCCNLNPVSCHVSGERDCPRIFKVQSQGLQSKYKLIPSATVKDAIEYNITTFVVLDSIAAKSMIFGANEGRDYPFKEWQNEHEIITTKQNGAILLLGRSGTGKTTCCLYRLWNEFKVYWPEVVTLETTSHNELEILQNDAAEGTVLEQDNNSLEAESVRESSLHVQQLIKSTSSICNSDNLSTMECKLPHVFLTKNYILCDQMKKRFYSMAAAYENLQPYLSSENLASNNLSSLFKNSIFPIFLTARQFYILLDNSLEHGETFFKRDEDGNLLVNIVSLDYANEDQDFLNQFEESDSEDLELELGNKKVGSLHSTKQIDDWIEITAVYFKAIIWPKISHNVDIDPMLVWLEIQSFIKGSLATTEGIPLSFKKYTSIGNKIAPNFADRRKEIYELYKRYENYKQKKRYSHNLFDEGDLILDLQQRLKEARNISPSFHRVYVDEVQDFTQAELRLLIQCCKDPNSMFFTGDTAQSIMQGVAFRFQDLRSCFHELIKCYPSIKLPQEPLKLTINYRSHSGIIKLAGSVIDLIKQFFRDSIDHLPPDEGMFPGPMPVFLSSCVDDDLSILMSMNGADFRMSSIEFGAHQAILVRSNEAKKKLPQSIKNNIILTIFEAKGLEFDDVLLYNFFEDSMVDEKVWRVITSYLNMPEHENKIENPDPLPGITSGSREKKFDEVHHKSLNAEFKHLYTAITRAKCNLWIYDSNEKARLPMLDYWHKRGAVAVVSEKSTFSYKTAVSSNPSDWKKQGDVFRKSGLWEQAIFCYRKAGSEYDYLAKESEAHYLIQSAHQHKPQLYLEASVCLLECNEMKHNLSCLQNAAMCLMKCIPHKYEEAGWLYEKLGKLNKALRCYKNACDFDSVVRILESRGKHDQVISYYLQSNKIGALMKSAEYEKKGFPLQSNSTTSYLANHECAPCYSKLQDQDKMLQILPFISDLEVKLKWMKEARMYDKAYEAAISKKMISEAHMIAFAQGWFKKAHGTDFEDEFKSRTSLILLEGKHCLLECSEENYSNMASVVKKTIENLRKNSEEKAEAHLLLGMFHKETAEILEAIKIFRSIHCKAGLLEAFEQLRLIGWIPNDHDVLYNCGTAYILCNMIADNFTGTDIENILVLHSIKTNTQNNYVVSEYGQLWLNFSSCANKKKKYDLNHMMCLDKKKLREILVEHYRKLMLTWLNKFGTDARMQEKRYSYNKFLVSDDHLTTLSSKEEVDDYIQLCEWSALKGELNSGEFTSIETWYSLNLSSVLYELNCDYTKRVRSSPVLLDYFEQNILSSLKNNTSKLSLDSWIWKICCISETNLKRFKKISRKKNLSLPGFFFWKGESQGDFQYQHIFFLWLTSCIEIKRNRNVLVAAKLAIEDFLGNVLKDDRISLSVSNILTVLAIHTVSMLAKLTYFTRLEPLNFAVPQMYESLIQMFNEMKCRDISNTDLFFACTFNLSVHCGIQKECIKLLNMALCYLLDSNYSLRGSLNGNGDVCKQYLILALTLFGNLLIIDESANMHKQNLCTLIEEVIQEIPETLSNADQVRQVLCDPEPRSNLPAIFDFIKELLVLTFTFEYTDILTIVFQERCIKLVPMIEFDPCQPVVDGETNYQHSSSLTTPLSNTNTDSVNMFSEDDFPALPHISQNESEEQMT